MAAHIEVVFASNQMLIIWEEHGILIKLLTVVVGHLQCLE